MMWWHWLKYTVAGIFLAVTVLAQPLSFGPPAGLDILKVEVVSSVDKLKPGSSAELALRIEIAEGWHINSVKPNEEFLIPTRIAFDPVDGVTFGRLEFPEALQKKFEFSEVPMAVYEGTIYVYTTVALAPDYEAPTVPIKGTVFYQACDDHTCLAPAELNFSREIPVAAPDEAVTALHEDVFRRAEEAPQPTPTVLDESSQLARTIESRGMLVAFLVIFVSGLALNLTPCVYPMIPITISYFGGQAGGKRGSLLLHAVIYVLGMAVTYSVLGVFAALTGSILGGWLQNPIVLIFIAGVMVALAMSMFGLYEIRVPAALANFAGQSKRGYLGTLFMGLTVGIIAAPCIGPFVLALFTYVGEKGDPVLGFWMFFVLAIGLGIPFLLLATFSGALNRLPRSGAWMVWVRKIFGFVLLAVGLYFVSPLLGNSLWYLWGLSLIFLIGGLYLAWIDPTPASGRVFFAVRNLVGVGFLIFGLYLAIAGVEGYVDQQLDEFARSLEGGVQVTRNEIDWQPYSPEALQQARELGKPVFIDFYADWCIPCKELDKFTFTDERVIALSRNFVNLKADLTRFDSPEVEALRNQFRIKGVPTLVFLTPDGKEIPGTRVIGFVNADDFVPIMEKALAAVSGQQE
ncbi:MAG: DUF255 domain-containing protein [Calditrichaeota bacterium]|nr:DUF255 domain-containing protein [Calditrichota bacterium]